MERLLVKTGIYSFIISFLLMFVFISRDAGNEFEQEAVMSLGEYFFMIGRYSVIVMMSAVILTFVGKKISEMD